MAHQFFHGLLLTNTFEDHPIPSLIPSENPPCADWVPLDQINVFVHLQPFPSVQIRFPWLKSIYLAIFPGGFLLGLILEDLDTILNTIPSAWKSSLKTAKKPRLNQTQTTQDWKFPGPPKTATAVWSMVHWQFEK